MDKPPGRKGKAAADVCGGLPQPVKEVAKRARKR